VKVKPKRPRGGQSGRQKPNWTWAGAFGLNPTPSKETGLWFHGALSSNGVISPTAAPSAARSGPTVQFLTQAAAGITTRSQGRSGPQPGRNRNTAPGSNGPTFGLLSSGSPLKKCPIRALGAGGGPGKPTDPVQTGPVRSGLRRPQTAVYWETASVICKGRAMPDKLFDVNMVQLYDLIRLFKTSPKKFAKATGFMLNDFAEGSRNAAIEVMHEKMTVRSRTFVSKQLIFQKTHTNPPIESQVSYMGSRPLDRSTGWKEQETGSPSPRERTITKLARGRSQTNKARPRFRMNKAHTFVSFHDYPGKNIEHKHIVMMQRLGRLKWQEPFIVVSKKGMVPGLYKFHRRRPRLLQAFLPPRKKTTRLPWLKLASDRYFSRVDINRMWRSKIRWLMKR